MMVQSRYNLLFQLITDYKLSFQRLLAVIAQDTTAIPLFFLDSSFILPRRLLDMSLISMFILAQDHSMLPEYMCGLNTEVTTSKQ